MKKILYNAILPIVCCLLTALSAVSCRDTVDDMGGVPLVSSDMFRIYVDSEDENLIHFEFTAEKLSPYWEIELPGGTQT